MKLVRAWIWLLLTSQLPAAMTVNLQTSSPASMPLGMPVTWTASVSGASAGGLLYRFQVEGPGGVFRTVVDYGPKAALTWTTIDQEGAYKIEVAVVNTATFEESVVSSGISFTSLVSGTNPVVTPSANPMVFIYSAPPCSASNEIQFDFRASLPGASIQFTPYQPCMAGVSRNFYLAGMLPGTAYQIQHVFDTRATPGGPTISFSVSRVFRRPAKLLPR